MFHLYSIEYFEIYKDLWAMFMLAVYAFNS